MTIAAALVAAAVLFWGTAYKCSLCHLHPERHARVAVAKLLSEAERPSAIEAAAALKTAASIAAFQADSQAPIAPPPAPRPRFESSPPLPAAGLTLSSLPHFFFRPPPRSLL